MKRFMVYFEDTTSNPDRAGNGDPSRGLPIKLLPAEVTVIELDFIDKSKTLLSGVLVEVREQSELEPLREISEKAGTIAWVREFSEHAWAECKTLDGSQAYRELAIDNFDRRREFQRIFSLILTHKIPVGIHLLAIILFPIITFFNEAFYAHRVMAIGISSVLLVGGSLGLVIAASTTAKKEDT